MPISVEPADLCWLSHEVGNPDQELQVLVSNIGSTALVLQQFQQILGQANLLSR